MEKSLWEQGCADWQTLIDRPNDFKLQEEAKSAAIKGAKASLKAFADGNHQYFAKTLGASLSWRAWPEFRDSCVYLDIETDGGQFGDSVTTIGMYDGKEFQCLVKGQDLDNFRDIISHYSMIVTFFGAGFDLPMLKKRFFGIEFDQIHIDLCPTLRQLGYKGGLKSIEKQLGIARGEESDGLSGLDAIRLWGQYLRHQDVRALETLIAYNREDVVNLETLAEFAYKRLRQAAIGSLFDTQ